MQAISNIIGLDIGDSRTGVSMANTIARIASPLTVIECSTVNLPDDLLKLVKEYSPVALVAGLPKGLSGQDTAQTKHIIQIVDTLKRVINLPIFTQDEANTSKQAEEELRSKGKPYRKGDIDALAATYILQDFIDSRLDNVFIDNKLTQE
ncbi:Holliday junction resolvase RuvX [Candidatus Saccharibacteria bacterium]|nr:Holliday junction resolvase RuvX [Candidatus Saccharibacteria bacterium]